MDAGDVALVGAVAAVLGAAVGAGGAVGAAAVTGRKQAQSQHNHWRRQVRRDAYAAHLVAVSAAISALDSAQKCYAGAASAASADLQQALNVVDEHLVTARSSGVVIFLEGPQFVASAASNIVQELYKWSWRLAGKLDPDSHAPQTDQIRTARQHTLTALEAFRAAAVQATQG
ncbi:hypothetical protein [Streptomyces sp. Je 1-369]|uniref:hypothetical protein n=1 Tax=Streptomyces sp. Je 1-369 TaxID=2966192 RepID=UPI002285F1CD|nr:hypothetical protein [Streptomyces sp. Je 1-369]WAL93960.1 hypothetical protein NOO62_05275 [Streptomyces sp. Je 1-369]